MHFLICLLLVSILLPFGYTSNVYLEGNVTIAGFFEIRKNENNGCGKISVDSVRNFEMVKWTIEQLNQENYIPGVKIGINVSETCRNTGIAAKETIDLLAKTTKETDTSTPPVVGIIGPEFSSETEMMSTVVSFLPENEQLLQILFSATAAVLSDKNIYKNLRRVIPSDAGQVQVMIELLKKLDWNYVAVVYENDVYGKDGLRLFSQKAKAASICIGLTSAVTIGESRIPSYKEIDNIIRDIVRHSESSISGVVVFGSDSTADLIFQSASGQDASLTFIFSEAAFGESVFENQIESRGSFVITPTQKTVDNFSKHWKSIFTNISYLQEQGVSNPWLYDVFHDYTNCKLSNSSSNPLCSPMTPAEADSKINSNLYDYYALQGIVILAKTLKLLHAKYCQSPGLCEGLKQILYHNPGKLIQESNNLFVNFDAEINFTNINLNISFNGSTDVVHTIDFTEYEVYQRRNCLHQPDSFCLEKVGNYSQGTLILEMDLLRDYHQQGNEGLAWPDFNKAQCAHSRKCFTCITSDLSDKIYFEDGDVFVGAVVPIYDKDPDNPLGCNAIRTNLGWEIAEAIAYAVKTVNEKKGIYSDFFKNKKVGMFIINSCNQAPLIELKLLSAIKNGIKLANGTTVHVTEKTLGFVSALGSTISVTTAEILQSFNFVQVSYASTATQLSDRSKYKYFTRVTTPDDKQAQTMMKIVEDLDSMYIQVLYSEGTYGEGGYAAVKEQAKSREICIAQAIMVKEGTYSTIYDDLRTYPYAEIVIIFLRSHVVTSVLGTLEARMTPEEFVFIASEAWGKRPEVLKVKQSLGAISLSIEMIDDPSFTHFLSNLNVANYTRNPWTKEYFQAKHKCYLDGSFDKSASKECPKNLKATSSSAYKQELWAPFAMNAMFSLLKGANAAFDELCGTQVSTLCSDYRKKPSIVWNKIIQQTLVIDDSGTEKRVFNTNGDGNVGYSIWQIQKDPQNSDNLKFVSIGRATLESDGYNFEKAKLKIPVKLPSVCPNLDACSQCSKNTTQPFTDLNGEMDTAAIIGLSVACAILAVLAIAAISVFICHFRRRICSDEDNQTYLDPENDDYVRTSFQMDGSFSHIQTQVRSDSRSGTDDGNDSGIANESRAEDFV